MDLLAVSYSNIGPFGATPITVVFKKGSYLVKAPIGSGKSFLFFDGPVFALYKYSKRPMLNRLARQGRIHAIFACEQELRYIERVLTPTKAGGESVSSALRKVSLSQEVLEERIAAYATPIIEQVDCRELLGESLEEISFTSQKELDAAVTSLLPAKEASLAVNFLMQDSENVFELPPAQRVVVFKHLFGLLGIDEGKERLAEKRRELQSTIRILEDQSQSTSTIQRFLKEIQELQKRMQPLPITEYRIITPLQALRREPFFTDLGLVQETVRIDQFSVEASLMSLIQTIVTEVGLLQQEKERLEGKKQAMIHDREVQKKERELRITEIAKKQSEIQTLDSHLDGAEKSNLELLLKQREELHAAIEREKVLFPRDVFVQAGYEVTSLQEACSLIDELVTQGKEYSHQLTLLESKKLQLQQHYDQLQQRKQETLSHITQIDTSYAQEMQFYCDKIQGDCPYIEVIKKQSVLVLQQQRVSLDVTLQALLEEIQALQYEEASTQLMQQMHQVQEESQRIRDFLQRVQRKSLKEAFQRLQVLHEQSMAVTQQITRLEMQVKQHDTLVRQKEIAGIELGSLEKELQALDAIYTQKHAAIELVEQELMAFEQQKLNELTRLLHAMAQCFLELQQLIQTHKANQLRLKQLQQDETHIKELYTIFSKELLFVVLQDFLPQLEQTINAYLVQVVEYEIRFQIPVGDGETIELDIEIHDANGARPVKSLSGGQRAVLKLARILAVAALMRSQFLLLDETINNLDVSTIGKVAEMLRGFMATKRVKVYLVTHAPQIQEMDIWDDTIDVQTNKNIGQN